MKHAVPVLNSSSFFFQNNEALGEDISTHWKCIISWKIIMVFVTTKIITLLSLDGILKIINATRVIKVILRQRWEK